MPSPDVLPRLSHSWTRYWSKPGHASGLIVHSCTRLSEAYLLVGRVDEASALRERLLDLSRTHTGRGYQAHAYRLLGDVAAHRDPPDSPRPKPTTSQALALAEELGMRPLQAHCHRGLGTLYAKLGRPEPARLPCPLLSTCTALWR